MCLYLTKKSKLKQATKDIVVYKTLKSIKSFKREKGISPYYGELYEKYNIYTSDVEINENLFYDIDNTKFIATKGLHSCLTFCGLVSVILPCRHFKP